MSVYLPNLDSEYIICKEKIEFFWQNGFVVLKNVLSKEEIEIYRKEIKDTTYKRSKNNEKSFGGAFTQALNLRFDSKEVQKFCLSKRLGKIAADLTKVNAMRIFHEQALFKGPGDTKTYWHQDQYFWPLDTKLHIGMWMPLRDLTKDMGLMRFVVGSHLDGEKNGVSISEDSENYYNNLIKKENMQVYELDSINAGDCTFHFGWTIHSAGINISNDIREVMVVTYFPDGTRVGKLDNESRLNDAKNFLGDKTTGEIANHSMNTIVYQK